MFFKKTVHEKTLQSIAKEMRKIDICMLSTHANDGIIASRPMSNNKDVDYNGDSYFFTLEEQGLVSQIERNSNVTLNFQTDKYLYIAVTGQAKLIRDKESFKNHWVPDLERWFTDGINTPGLVLVKVQGQHLKYWDGMDEGELSLSPVKQAA
jgi:general stress protein 26